MRKCHSSLKKTIQCDMQSNKYITCVLKYFYFFVYIKVSYVEPPREKQTQGSGVHICDPTKEKRPYRRFGQN